MKTIIINNTEHTIVSESPRHPQSGYTSLIVGNPAINPKRPATFEVLVPNYWWLRSNLAPTKALLPESGGTAQVAHPARRPASHRDPMPSSPTALLLKEVGIA